MLLTRSVQYTLRALIHLARQPEGHYVMTRDVADALRLPPHFLAKLLQPLARKGWLRSSRGRAGGVRLADEARELSILAIIEALEEPGSRRDCLLGLKDCDDDTACVLHCRWKPVKHELTAYLAGHDLARLAADDATAGRLLGCLGDGA